MSFTVTTRVATANLRGAASAQPRQPAPTPPRRHLPTRPPPRRSEAKPHWTYASETLTHPTRHNCALNPLTSGQTARPGPHDIGLGHRHPIQNEPRGRTKRPPPPAALATRRSRRTGRTPAHAGRPPGMRPAIEAGTRGPCPRPDGV